MTDATARAPSRLEVSIIMNHCFAIFRRGPAVWRVMAAHWMRMLALLLLLLTMLPARSDSVGQVQTTKYFAPETQTLLKNRVLSGTPGLFVGDLVSYIIEFTPVPNSAFIGAGGYITDYIPAGTQVVGAWFVEPDGAGDFRQTSPPNPALMAPGWGRRGQATYSTSWSNLPIDASTVSTCTAAGYNMTNCNGRLSEVYADTGIFYSTDPRTAVFTYPDTDGRVRQSANGYRINPTGTGQLNPIIGQTVATVHNYWDAANINAFGSTATDLAALGSPKASTLYMQSAGGAQGTGSSPFNAGSAVAGPDVGYKLDYTGAVGPWRRISYPGSVIGTSAAGPATGTGVGADVVPGSPTAAGWVLSTSNPLPSNTNAVRWAAGNLTVGTVSHVKITLRLTAAVPSTGLVNNSEVFGGDASPADPGAGDRESVWRYTVPSVADNNSSLLITKQVVCVFSGTVCNAAAGAVVPASPTIRYRILYLNSGNGFQNNVVLNDLLDSKASAAGNLYVVSGTDLRPSSPVLSVNSAAVGATRGADVALTSVTGGTTVTFPPLVALPPGLGGAFEIDVKYGTLATVGAILSNRATLVSAQVPGGAKAAASSIVTSTANLVVSKTTSTPNVLPGGTATYTITIQNVGNGTASAIVVDDFLPFTGTTANANTRFSYLSTSSITGLTAVTPTISNPPAVTPYSGNANQQQVTWTLNGTTKTLAAGASATITFNARVGSSMPALAAGYTNDVKVSYNDNTQVVSAQVNDTAPVAVSSTLSITKTIDCIYSGAVCNAYTGSEVVPANGKLRYKISYANIGITAHTNVYVCDQLPTQVAAFSSVTTPAVAPTPSGPYTNSPAIGTPTSAANAACGFGAGGITFSYPVISSLAAGATGTVYFDVQTNAASGATLLNTGKIVSTESPGGATSAVSIAVRDEAKLTVTKTTSTPTIPTNGTASYTITVANTGNANASAIQIYDFLPYSGSTANSALRFSYSTATTAISGMTSVAPATVTAPTITPYSSNTNQEQVLWNFGAQTLAPGASFTIAFNARAGASLPAGSTIYGNDVQASYASGSGTTTAYVSAAAPVVIASNLSITKTIDCIYNTAGTICNAYDGSGIVPVNGKIRYKVAYANTGSTAQTNVYVCDTLPTQIASYAAAVSTPSIAPTPLGSYLDSPSLGSRVNPANAACGVSGTTFSYPVIASLAAGASGTVYYDVLTNAASGALVTNTAKVVSTYAPSGEVSAVSATALSVPNVVVSKTTSTPSLSPGGTATYTITVTNVGSAATTSLKVYDFLPYSGTAVDATKQFTYVANSTSLTGSLPGTYTVTTAVSPTVVPYNSNSNQQQVLWDFGNYAMPAGGSATITFSAKVGSTMPSASYGNAALAAFVGAAGSGAGSVADAADIVVSSPPTITKAFDAPKVVTVNGLTTLTFTLTNPNSIALTGGSFTDDFPTGTVLGATSLGGTCSGDTLTSRASTGATPFSAATVGHISVQVSGFTIPASSSCTVLVTVKGTTVGAKANTSSVLTSTNIVPSTTTGSDTLNVYATPTVTKAFGTSTMVATGTTTLSLTLGNPSGNPGSITGISVSDVFPVTPGAMTLGSASTTNGCSGASLQGKTGAGAYGAVAVGNTAIQVSGLSLAAGTTCTVVVTVTASSTGTYSNVTNAITATGTSSGAVAITGSTSNTATLVVTAQNPSLVYMKTVMTLNDPVNGAVNPKNIPGAEVRYSLRVTNQGPGTVDSDSMILTDQVPANTELYVGDLAAPFGPIGFVNSTTPVSGLSWTYTSLSSTTDGIAFSNTASPGPYVFNYTPVPNGQGYDSSVTAIRLNPKGTMAGASGGNNPYAEFQFKVRIK
jgi:uncharacterized repeat protein (TIGR01451 family)